MDLSCKRLLSFFTPRSLITFSPVSLPTAGFPRGMVDLLRTLFHFLPSLNPPPPPVSTPTFLSPTSTNASSYLVTRALFCSPQPPTVMVLFHRTWPLPVPLFTTLTSTRTHASHSHSKSSRGHQFSTRAKALQPQLQARRWSSVA